MDKYYLLTDQQLKEIVGNELVNSTPFMHEVISMCLELLEYRKHYGPLSCQWLAKE